MFMIKEVHVLSFFSSCFNARMLILAIVLFHSISGHMAAEGYLCSRTASQFINFVMFLL